MTADGRLASLLLERTLPRAERDRFDRAIVGWYTDELNGLGDRLRYWASRRSERAERERARALARLQRTVAALRWNAEEVMARVCEGLEQAAPEGIEDWFAPAVLLGALVEDPARWARLRARVPPRAREEAAGFAKGAE